MRTLLTCAMAIAMAHAPAMSQAQDKVLTLSTYGFGQDVFKELLYDPFEEICGCTVVTETGNSIERMSKIEANAASPVVDLAAIASHDALSLARKGLLQPLDHGRISNVASLHGFARDPIGQRMGVGYTLYATSIVYRSDLVRIDSWSDLLSPELAGKVALPDVSTTQGPIVLHMLGKSIGQQSPDLLAPIMRVAEHSDDIVTFYVRSSQLAQLMQQEEVIAAPVGRFAWSRFSGGELPFAWAEPKEGQTGGLNVLIMTKGNGNEDLAYQFIDYWLSADVQKRIADAGIDSPVNKDVVLDAEAASKLTYGDSLIASIDFLDPAVIIDNRESWIEAWNSNVVK